MPDAPAVPTTSPRRSASRLLLLLPVLLIAAIAVNWSSIQAVASGKKSLRSIVYGINSSPDRSIEGWRTPPNAGEPTAKVAIEVFIMPGDPCHADTMFLGRALGTLDPARIRVRFVGSGTAGPQGKPRAEEVKLGCDQGLAINGKTQFSVPDPAHPGKQRTVFTSHKGGGLDPGTLYPLLDRELKAAYDGKGLPMTPAEFTTRMSTEVKRFETIEIALADGRHAAQQSKDQGKSGPQKP
jgi:hypothetical protein